MNRRKIKSIKKKQIAVLTLVVFAICVCAASMALKQIKKVCTTYSQSTGGQETATRAAVKDTEICDMTTKTNSVTPRNSREAYDIDSRTENLITGYFTTWFDALAGLKEKDITQYFDMSDDQGAVSAQVNQAALDFLVGVRDLQENDLTLSAYASGFTYTNANILDNGDLEITLEEDHQVNFSFIADTDSYSAGIAHTFVFREEEGTLRIIQHEKEEDGYLLVAERYEEASQGAASTQTTQLLKNIKATLLEEAAEDIESLNQAKQEAATAEDTTTLWDNDYDREAAVDYAMDWVDTNQIIRNEDWGLYDSYGGNCNNYISQCLYAGGIPMDSTGDAQWKWYDDSVNARQSESGRSPSWAGVQEFFTYAESNSGAGLIADTTANIYTGQSGDVLQYGTNDEWNHSVIITDVVTNGEGQIADYLINSNTTDRINYPASAYAYSNIRLVKVLGWNE